MSTSVQGQDETDAYKAQLISKGVFGILNPKNPKNEGKKSTL